MVLSIATLALGGGSATYAQNGVEMEAASFQARARGGSDVAVGDTALSQIDNPATLSLIESRRLDFSGQVIFPRARWSGPLDADYSSVKVVPLLDFGYGERIDEYWSWGVALNSKSGLASSFDYRPLLMPWTTRRLGADAKIASIPIDFAYRVSERLSLGFGGRVDMAMAEFRTTLSVADFKFERGYSFGGGYQLGLLYRPRDDVAIGAGYRSPTWASDITGGDAEISLFSLPSLTYGRANIDELRLPQKAMAGVAWDVTPRLKLVGEARWINYDHSSWSQLTVAANGPVDLRVPFPLGYRDQWVFIGGAEYRLNPRWVLSGGYNYGTTPLGRSHVCPIGSVLTQHHFNVGVRYERERWWAGVGYSRIPLGVDCGLGELSHSQHSLLFGFGVQW